ncbi:MAG: AMP-binding protein [Actinobacteria bacterium]|nr:AMP-binding protein [Actinomycetota bacterium]MCA1738981.1 AMP-binding protein [Actinomycetota bacterium]
MILRDTLEFAAARYPEKLAMVDGDRRYTYGEWDERVNAVANALRRLDVGKGDRVVQVIKNREENCAIHMACQKLGAINTPINFRWASGEIEFCVNDAEARLVVIEKETAERVLSIRDEFHSDPRMLFVGPDSLDGVDSFDEAVEASERTRPSEEVKETDISLMLYTSGTTGRPKGVPRSQRAEHAATIAQIVEHHYSLGERTLGVMPLFHTMGMHSLTAMLALNGLFVAMPQWDAKRALEIIEREQLTCLYLIPTLFHELVNHEAFERQHTASVRKLSYAGASMLSALVEKCIEKFQPDVFINHYGSTEVYIFSTYPKPREKPGCAGRASFHTELRVVRADPEPSVSPDEVVLKGETGEIIVRLSDDAFAGYYNRPEVTEKAIRNGWYFTGDTGYLDEDGDLWMAGRVDDMINTGGENVYPVEVEDVLDKHPEVSEVAVVGLPDEKWGQAVTAFVVPGRQGMTEEDISSYLKEDTNLARFKHPKRVVFVKEIPKSPVGKLLRRLLVEGEYEEVKPPTEDAEVNA